MRHGMLGYRQLEHHLVAWTQKPDTVESNPGKRNNYVTSDKQIKLPKLWFSSEKRGYINIAYFVVLF